MNRHGSYFMKFLLCTFVLTLLLSSMTVLAATIRVPQDYPTIQAGIDAATDGDTVLVADGTYSGEGNINISFGFYPKNITVKSENGSDNCAIDCEGEGPAFLMANYFETIEGIIKGFTINNCIEGIFCADDCKLTIEDCIISGNSATGIKIYSPTSSVSTISDCTINRNTGYGIIVTGSAIVSNCSITDNTGFGIGAGGSSLITGCTVRRNASGGILIGSGYPIIDACTISENTLHGGITIHSSYPKITNSIISNNDGLFAGGIDADNSFPTITNCTISNNSGGFLYGGITVGSSHMTITNSILWENTPDEINLESGSVNVTYSGIQGDYSGTGNLNLDPLFVGGGDYHLTASSPCIDKGTSEGAPDHDIDGELRPHGAGFDMGADEYGAVKPQLNADFFANPIGGPTPLTVNFIDQSIGATSWSWDFGDGVTSTEQNPAHTYTDSGAYTVSLTVTGPEGTDTETKTDFIVARDASFSTAAAFAVLANMYSDSAMANAVNALNDPSYYPLAALYASSAYEYAEDAYEDATAALAAAQSYTFWGYYAANYAEHDFKNKADALDYFNQAVAAYQAGDLAIALEYLGYGFSSACLADLYNGTTVWCASMESAGATK